MKTMAIDDQGIEILILNIREKNHQNNILIIKY